MTAVPPLLEAARGALLVFDRLYDVIPYEEHAHLLAGRTRPRYTITSWRQPWHFMYDALTTSPQP